MEKYKSSKKAYRILIFMVGVTATICYRSIVVLNHVSAFWVDVVWHIGTIGFIWYFVHRFKIENKRDKMIENNDLWEKIRDKKELTDEERENLVNLLYAVETSPAKWNYMVIFITSALALGYSLAINLIKWLS